MYEADQLEQRAKKLIDYGNSLPDGVTTEAFAEAANLKRKAAELRKLENDAIEMSNWGDYSHPNHPGAGRGDLMR